jgi:glycosyltransferase involved in cell wall biosynthesis
VFNAAAGGAARSSLDLIVGLDEAGVRSCVVCPADGTPEEQDAIADAVGGRVLFRPLYRWQRKIRTPWWRRPAMELYQWQRTGLVRGSTAAVAAFARDQHADLLHTNTLLNPEGGRAAARLGLAHVWHVRELVGPGAQFRFWRESSFLPRRVVPLASVVVANSEATAARLAHLGLPGATVVPDGLVLDDLLAVSAPGPTTAADRPVVVGMVANLMSFSKRHDLFVDAAALLDPDLPVELRIVGHDRHPDGRPLDDPPVRALRERIRSAGLADRITFAGYAPDPAAIMAGLDVVVQPSGLESFGRTLVEAMAAARPVVAATGGAACELVDDGVTGLLVPPDDAPALARAIDALVRDPQRRRVLGEAGRARAQARYGVGRAVDQLLDVYARALTRPVGQSPGQAADTT